MSNNKQSSVEWLISQQKHNKLFDIETIEQAKAMHKDEIDESYSEGYQDGHEIAENFYKETYGGNK